jgi:hypothetical protein
MAAWDKEQAKLTPRDRRAVPPVNLNDLGDLNLLSQADLAADSYLTANVWNGDTATEVTVQIDDQEPRSRPAPSRRRARGSARARSTATRTPWRASCR